MKASKVMKGAYQCYSCDDDFVGEPEVIEVIHVGLASGLPTWEEADDNGWIWEKVTCADGCDQYQRKGDDGELFHSYDDPWQCGKCGGISEGVASAMKCCS